MVTAKKKTTSASLTTVTDRKRVEIQVKVPKTENIIFIGSEMYYDSFWLKMMFVAAAYRMAEGMRDADRVVIAYVDEGYTHLEKLAIDQLAKQCMSKTRENIVEVKKLVSSSAVTNLLNRAREDYKLLDVFFSSHGVVGTIDLSYRGDDTVQLTNSSVSSVFKHAFAQHGRVFSYACRTGIGSNVSSFKNEVDAKLEESLAQKIADHFGVEVHAFLRRSFYGNVLRDKSESESIVKSLVAGRKAIGDDAVIDIPPAHEGLPHDGLADGWGFGGPKREGTDSFALWRKKGGRTLPTAADTPTGLATDMRVFHPRKT